MELNGKVAVVTGASMGIGEAIAKLFVQKGANVVFLSRDTARAEAARTRAGHTDRTIALSCDIRNREEIDKVINLTVHSFQRIDIWVNNAGKGIMDASDHADMASVRDVFNLNFFGALESMQAVAPVMKQQGSGTIINISSVAGHLPLPFHGVYSATKFAMNAVGKAARIEVKQVGNQCADCLSGVCTNRFWKKSSSWAEAKTVRPQQTRGISAERVARATLQGYLKQKREVVVPWHMHPVIKLYQLFPGIVEWGMLKMIRKVD